MIDTIELIEVNLRPGLHIEPVFCGIRLLNDVLNWCRENLKDIWQYDLLSINDDIDKPPSIYENSYRILIPTNSPLLLKYYACFKFKNNEEAIMFKLTWG